jgi:hypothetical protein
LKKKTFYQQKNYFCFDSLPLLVQHLFQVSQFTILPHPLSPTMQAEVCSKVISKYVAAFGDSLTLDWEIYVPALMFEYNTSFHC